MFSMRDISNRVSDADKRIRAYIIETPLEYYDTYSEGGKYRLGCKLENLQITGSFKLRGALNKILSLSEDARATGVVTASTGNHGAAVAYAMHMLNIPGLIFVPENASPDKIKKISDLSAEVRYFGDDNALTEAHARGYATDNGMTYVSPYNDIDVVAGQGTVGLEIERQTDNIDAVFVSLGGGGLIAGIAARLKTNNPNVKIIGCSPENSQVMIQSVKAGKLLDIPSLPTISDGTAGGVEPGAITFDMCMSMVDEYVTVTEEEIKVAMKRFIAMDGMFIEGAAGVALASFEKTKERWRGKNVVAIICGGNVSKQVIDGL